MSYVSNARARYGFISVLVGILLVVGCQSDSSREQQSASEPSLPDGELAIKNPWVRPAPAGSSSVLYMTIANGQETADTLRRVRAPIIGGSEVRTAPSDTAAAEDTTATEFLAVPARTQLVLSPEATHVRLTELSQSFDENSTVILNLEFAQSGLQRVRVPVQTSLPAED